MDNEHEYILHMYDHREDHYKIGLMTMMRNVFTVEMKFDLPNHANIGLEDGNNNVTIE